MNDSRPIPPPVHDPHDSRVSHDLHALRDTSAHDLPSLSHSLAHARSRRPDSGHSWRNSLMASTRAFARRPLISAGIAALLILVALVIPVSYQRTTGHQVALSFAGVTDAEQLRPIAAQLKTALRAEQVRVKAESVNGAMEFTLEALAPAGRRIDAVAVATAFARNLEAKGYKVRAVTTPVLETVSGNVYAYARDIVVRVDTDGKTAAQIQAEIQQQIVAAGIPDAVVSVTDEGQQRKVTLEVQRTSEGKDADAPGGITLQLTKGGKPESVGDGFSVEERMLRSDTGTALQFVIADGAKHATFEIPGADHLTDAALQSAVEAKLREAGIAAKVTVTDGRVSISR